MLAKCIEERSEQAMRFMSQHGFQVTNRNGQRVSTNLANLPQLSHADQPYSEIFLGKVPRDLFEDELLPVLLEVGGTIKKIRYMMDFSGYNRGFAFVKFTSTNDAAIACKLLDGRALRPNVAPIGARISFDNKCLYFGNLPIKCSARQLVSALKKIDIPGVVGARMAESAVLSGNGCGGGYTSPQDRYHCDNPRSAPPPPIERFCHVEFQSHEAATIARRMLLPSEVRILGRKITIDWSKSEIPQEVQEQVRKSPVPRISPAPSTIFNHQSPRKIVPYLGNNFAQKKHQYLQQQQQQHRPLMIAPYNSYPVLQRNNRRTTSDGSNISGNSTSSLNSNMSSIMNQKFCTDWHPMMANHLHGAYNNFINNKVF